MKRKIRKILDRMEFWLFKILLYRHCAQVDQFDLLHLKIHGKFDFYVAFSASPLSGEPHHYRDLK